MDEKTLSAQKKWVHEIMENHNFFIRTEYSLPSFNIFTEIWEHEHDESFRVAVDYSDQKFSVFYPIFDEWIPAEDLGDTELAKLIKKFWDIIENSEPVEAGALTIRLSAVEDTFYPETTGGIETNFMMPAIEVVAPLRADWMTTLLADNAEDLIEYLVDNKLPLAKIYELCEKILEITQPEEE